MVQISVLTGPERRRRWSDAQKLELLAQAFGPGGSPAETARQADICTSLLYRWRRASRAMAAPIGFSPAVLIEGPEVSAGRIAGPAVLVELPGGARVSVMTGAPAALVTAVLRALR
jgi:transposase